MSWVQRNKRGEVHIGVMVVHVLIFMVILLVMGFTLKNTTEKYIGSFTTYHKPILWKIYSYRVINTCLAYQDPVTHRYYPGIVDYSKYNQETLDACFADTSVKSFNIQLKNLEKPEDYPRILVGFGASQNIRPYSVWIKYEDGSMSKGELLIGVS